MICIEASKADKEILEAVWFTKHDDTCYYYILLDQGQLHLLANNSILPSDKFVELDEFKEIYYQQKLLRLL